MENQTVGNGFPPRKNVSHLGKSFAAVSHIHSTLLLTLSLSALGSGGVGASHITFVRVGRGLGASHITYVKVRGAGGMSNIRKKVIGAQIWVQIGTPEAFLLPNCAEFVGRGDAALRIGPPPKMLYAGWAGWSKPQENSLRVQR